MARNTSGLRRGGPGRPKGVQNKATREIKDFGEKLLKSKEYRDALKARIIAGEAPQMEQLLHHYTYGKPAETVKMDPPLQGPPVIVVAPGANPSE